MEDKRVLTFGIVAADVFSPLLDAIPEEGHLVQVSDIELHCGGCAANAAVGLARLGIDVTPVGKVGDDLFGKAAIQYLQARGVRTDAITTTPRYGTSKTIILPVRGQDRRFIHCFGANVALSAEDLKHALTQPVDYIYVGGYLAIPAVDPSEMASVLHDVRAGGTKVILDVVMPMVDIDQADVRSKIEPVLAETDIFVPNEDEAAAMSGNTDGQAQADFFLQMGAQSVILTRGADGSYYKSASEQWLEPSPKVEYADGSGAGDAFCAGLIFGLAHGLPTRESVRLGSAYGASACRDVGCTTSLLSRDEMDELAEALQR